MSLFKYEKEIPTPTHRTVNLIETSVTEDDFRQDGARVVIDGKLFTVLMGAAVLLASSGQFNGIPCPLCEGSGLIGVDLSVPGKDSIHIDTVCPLVLILSHNGTGTA